MERRLAAVLIADVVGYGRLSQIDEEGTRARFQADLKEIFEPKIAAYRGRLIKTMGDGLLVEFPSVVDALRCAVEVQQEKAKRNAAAPPEQRLDFRIGVNLGDIIVEGDDIHGDGVNIADRMQALAEPGGVAISGTAYDQVKAKLPVGYASLGEQKVKSIAEPVRVYRVRAWTRRRPARRSPRRRACAPGAFRQLPRRSSSSLLGAARRVVAAVADGGRSRAGGTAAAADTQAVAGRAALRQSERRRRAGLSRRRHHRGSDDGAGAHPGPVRHLAQRRLHLQGQGVQPAQIATELGVRYILEGSIRRAGDDMRINAQLIDATTSGHMWAERFDGALERRVRAAGQGHRERRDGAETPAHLGPERRRGRWNERRRGIRRLSEGLGFQTPWRSRRLDQGRCAIQTGVDLDPNFGRAWAELADMYWISYGNPEREAALGVANEDMMDKAHAFLEEAAKHPSPPYYIVLADLLILQQKSDEAIDAMERAIALDPSDPFSYQAMAQALIYNGRAADGKTYIDTAMRVDPRQTTWRYREYGLAYFCMGRYEEAIASLEKIDPETPELWLRYYGMFFLLAAHAHLGHTGEAAAVKKQLGRLTIKIQNANLSVLEARSQFPFKQPADTERLLDGLRKAGVPELPFGYDWDSPDRLTGEEIRSLLFGHDVEGSNPATGERYTRRTAIDGTTEISGNSRPEHGLSWIEGDTLCRWVTTDSPDLLRHISQSRRNL